MKKLKIGILVGALVTSLLLPAGTSVQAADSTAVHYGTVQMTWNQLYGNDNFDAITSATVNFKDRIENAVAAENGSGGTDFTGVKNVPVLVTDEVYQEYQKNKDNLDAKTVSEAAKLASEVTYSDKVPSWYITLDKNGYEGITSDVFKKSQGNKVTEVAVASATIEAPSAWGDYCVQITEATQKYLGTGRTFSGEIGFSNLLGATVTAEKNGVKKVYTLGYMENLWTATYEFSFRIAKDSEMVHMGNSTNYKQFAGIEGSTIQALTYYTTDGIYNFDLSGSSLKVKNQIPASKSVSGDTKVAIAEDGSLSVKIDSSKLPGKFTLESVGRSNGHGNTNVEAGSYSYKNGVLKITADGVTAAGGVGSYEAVFTDQSGQYVDAEFAFEVLEKGTVITPEVKKGSVYTVGNYKYKVTQVAGEKTGTVTVTQTAKNGTSITIPKTVKIEGTTYKVTAIAANAFKGNTKATKITIGANVSSIGKNAFYNCKNIKTVTLQTTKLTTSNVGSGAFSKLGASNYKKVTVKAPSSKLKAYKTLLTKKGLSSKAKITK
jgi:hypothetical protein